MLMESWKNLYCGYQSVAMWLKGTLKNKIQSSTSQIIKELIPEDENRIIVK